MDESTQRKEDNSVRRLNASESRELDDRAARTEIHASSRGDNDSPALTKREREERWPIG